VDVCGGQVRDEHPAAGVDALDMDAMVETVETAAAEGVVVGT